MRAVPGARLLSAFTLILAILVAIPAAAAAQPADNGSPGNSGAAKMCQQDGWRTVAPAGSPVGFGSQGECVSYGAQGGELASLSGIVVPAGATVSFNGQLAACNSVSGSWSASDGSSGFFGELDETFGGSCGSSLAIAGTAGPFPNGVVLTLALVDRSCNPDLAFDSNSNHASVVPTGAGYQVDIADTNWRCAETGPRVPAVGGGNLSVAIDVAR